MGGENFLDSATMRIAGTVLLTPSDGGRRCYRTAMSSRDIVDAKLRVWRGGMMILDHPVLPLLGRLMMTYIFATSGIGKVFGWQDNAAYMSTRHLPMISVLLAVAMVIEVAGSVCLVIGYQARIAAFVMFWYTTAVTVLFHNY